MNNLQSPVNIKVTIPHMPEKPEWKLNGQMLSFTLSLPESVANLKAKIQEEINMPPAKQKLFFDVSYFKLVFNIVKISFILGYVLQRFQYIRVL